MIKVLVKESSIDSLNTYTSKKGGKYTRRGSSEVWDYKPSTGKVGYSVTTSELIRDEHLETDMPDDSNVVAGKVSTYESAIRHSCDNYGYSLKYFRYDPFDISVVPDLKGYPEINWYKDSHKFRIDRCAAPNDSMTVAEATEYYERIKNACDLISELSLFT